MSVLEKGYHPTDTEEQLKDNGEVLKDGGDEPTLHAAPTGAPFSFRVLVYEDSALRRSTLDRECTGVRCNA